MVISKEELRKLIEVRPQIDKLSTLSYDGKNLLIRIPKEIKDHFNLKKGCKLRWVVNNDQILIEPIIL